LTLDMYIKSTLWCELNKITNVTIKGEKATSSS
jgi:hypothetical protein